MDLGLIAGLRFLSRTRLHALTTTHPHAYQISNNPRRHLTNSSDSLKPPAGTHRATPEQLEKIKEQIVVTWPRFFKGTYFYENHSQDITFIDNTRNIKAQGLAAYCWHINLVKMVCLIRYSRLSFHILNIVPHNQESYIKVRWRIEGQPGIVYMMLFFWRHPARVHGAHDGISTIFVDKNGFIDCHVVDNIEYDTEEVKQNNLKYGFISGLGKNPS